MALSNEERGFLEKLIDQEIKGMKGTIDIARGEQSKREWQVQNDEDFALGWALSTIFNNFVHYISNIHQKRIDQVDIEQTIEIITKRVREIKEAIFKCG